MTASPAPGASQPGAAAAVVGAQPQSSPAPRGAPRNGERTPRWKRLAAAGLPLPAAGLAILLFATLLAALSLGAHVLARRYIYALAPDIFDAKVLGLLLQREALRHPDLLPVYGSSELVRPMRNDAASVFRTQPTGFAVFPIGGRGTPPLITLETITALGPALRGRPVVISLSPGMFRDDRTAAARRQRAQAYAGNFSRLTANEIAFGAPASPELRRRVALRMMRFPQPLQEEPLLAAALHALTDTTPAGRARYLLLRPFGQAQLLLLHRADELRVIAHLLRVRPPAPTVLRQQRAVNWDSLATVGEAQFRNETRSNPFGIEDKFWAQYGASLLQRRRPTASAEVTQSTLRSPLWGDLALLFAALREAGAHPFVISMPFKGGLLDSLYVSAAARAAYYERLRRLTSTYGVPSVDFSDYDRDRYFLWDAGSHPSPKGWALYDQALDRFYHATAR